MENQRSGELRNTITSSITILISAITFYFSVAQYFYSQNLIDRRKYYNQYYDERYRVLTELAKSTTKIYSKLKHNKLSPDILRDSIKSELIIFNYAYLILSTNTSDSILIKHIETFQDHLSNWISSPNENANLLNDLYETNKLILQESGKIFSHEKDIINSFEFKLWPFSVSPIPNKG
ncbi:MAG: hypothetical protein V9E90_03410 [Saprospiraceae bacterium]